MKSDTNNNVNYLADELQQRYDELTKFSDREFFLATVNYIEFVIKSPGLQPVVELMDSDKARALQRISDSELLEDTKLQAVWASWDELKEIHGLISKFRTKIENLDPKEDFQEWFYTIAAHDKLNEILEKKSKPNNPFTRSEFFLHIGRVHRFIKEELIVYEKVLVNPPQTRKFYLEGEMLFFQLVSGKLDPVDFSGAPAMWRVFKTFWNCWEEAGVTSLEPNKLVCKYKELFNKDITHHYIAEVVSNIRASKLNRKPHLRERIVWEFDNKSEKWLFEIH